jgi:hypothetical protein
MTMSAAIVLRLKRNPTIHLKRHPPDRTGLIHGLIARHLVNAPVFWDLASQATKPCPVSVRYGSGLPTLGEGELFGHQLHSNGVNADWTGALLLVDQENEGAAFPSALS